MFTRKGEVATTTFGALTELWAAGNYSATQNEGRAVEEKGCREVVGDVSRRTGRAGGRSGRSGAISVAGGVGVDAGRRADVTTV